MTMTSGRNTHASLIIESTAPAKLESIAATATTSDQQRQSRSNQAMESETNNHNRKKNNAINVQPTTEKRMESEAATKIQAGFRGYQVRKQLKANKTVDQKRQLRKRSSKENMKENLEEQSATKIQAGVRGFLVRRRQKKQSSNSSASA
ncbi:hypothetical protein ABEB36_006523 [Hypothenemus hampei]|uniref:Uncharacterized protein n=1 Tax=Hypothenemus hampei TaxID=57062 RepID=A0ABD1EQU2_HYPHA